LGLALGLALALALGLALGLALVKTSVWCCIAVGMSFSLDLGQSRTVSVWQFRNQHQHPNRIDSSILVLGYGIWY
jgi:hypothetical protein